MKTDEQVAEEYSLKWIQTEYPEDVALVGSIINSERQEDYAKGFLAGAKERDRWWATRWQKLCCLFGDDNLELQKSMDARAKEALEES